MPRGRPVFELEYDSDDSDIEKMAGHSRSNSLPHVTKLRPAVRAPAASRSQSDEVDNRNGRGHRVKFDSSASGRPFDQAQLEAINEKLSRETKSDPDEDPHPDDDFPELERSNVEAHRLVRHFTQKASLTPDEDDRHAEHGRLRRDGLLSLLLKLQNRSTSGASTPATPAATPPQSASPSGTTTPTSFFRRNRSANSLSQLLSSASSFTAQAGHDLTSGFLDQAKPKLDAIARDQKKKEQRERRERSRESWTPTNFKRLAKRKDKERKFTTLIAETIDKHQYLIKLCRALMRYGAPTHRLEAYMRTSAHSLDLGGQFLYIPGCMIISFDDENTHTADVKLVRENQGVDLGRMDSCHNIYKQVANGTLTVREGTNQLNDLMNLKPKYSRPVLVAMYGLASASVGPFAFQARMKDTPISFVLGCIVGLLQYYINPLSELWSSCFTILAPLLTSAIARLFGSIYGGEIFCFSAIAQSSIALILPGYTVLCSALELQSGNIVAGSIRLVYALIYSLFLGFGITLGTVIVGTAWKDASSATSCAAPMTDYYYFLAVPVFTLCLSVINQAKWKQAPAQMAIALAGYQVNFWVGRQIRGQSIANAAGACAVGLLANSYARFGYAYERRLVRWCRRRVRPRVLAALRVAPPPLPVIHVDGCGDELELEHGIDENMPRRRPELATPSSRTTIERATYGLAAAAMLPAIWVQVPSGLAVNGSLVGGVTSANQITRNATGVSVAGSAQDGQASAVNSVALSVGYSVIQIAVGITVGLFASAVVVYPRGKKRGAVFTM